jgi:ABC-type Na+ efflux pump permease subunit
MKFLMLLAYSALVLTSTVAAEKETRCFELRT